MMKKGVFEIQALSVGTGLYELTVDEVVAGDADLLALKMERELARHQTHHTKQSRHKKAIRRMMR